MDYLYDGSFDGLLTAVYHHYYSEKASGIYPAECYQYNLLNPCKMVTTDPDLAGKVYDAIEQKISAQALQQVYYAFLADAPGKENLILNYLRLAFRLGPQVIDYHTHPDILPIDELQRKVSGEVHRFLGLLRFMECNRYLYAGLAPDHHILIPLAEHFADRLAGENFIIHDQKRRMAVIYNQKEWYLTDFTLDRPLAPSAQELLYQELWTQYFVQIGIETRQNKKLQAQFVPQRYRRNLVEFRRSLLQRFK